MSMIRIDTLTVCYGSLVAVNGISLEVNEGEIFGLVGPNGAGKTTTLKVLAGLLMPDKGTVEVDGHNIVSERDAVRARIGYMADFFGVYDYLTVHEYLAFFGGMYGASDKSLEERIIAMLETVKLVPKKDAYIRTLSRGMKQRLYFARALIHNPDLLILDEPASGLDPRGRAELFQTLKDVQHMGKTVLISSHILSELQDIVTSVGIMETGHLIGTRSFRPTERETKQRRVILHLAANDIDRAMSLLEKRDKVSAITRTDSGILFETDDDDHIVTAIVKYMINENIQVLLPRADEADLKDVFLKMTKGELM